MSSSVLLRWLQRGFLGFGLLLLGVWLEAAYQSRSFQSAESWKLDAALGGAKPSNAAFVGPLFATSPSREPDGVLGRIEISRLGIAAMVAEGSDTRTLARAVGHIPSSAFPGRPGNCALAGHRDTFLRGLGGVRLNDVIRIVTPEGTYSYEVAWAAVVEPQRVDVLDSTATRSLTLVTCYPFEYIGHAPQRFVVRATEVVTRMPHRFTQGRSAFQGGSDNE